MNFTNQNPPVLDPQKKFMFSLPGKECEQWPTYQTAKSTQHPHKTDDQHRECKTGGGAYFAFFFLRFRQFEHYPQKTYHLMREVFCLDGAWFAVPYTQTFSRGGGGGKILGRSKRGSEMAHSGPQQVEFINFPGQYHSNFLDYTLPSYFSGT